MKIISQIDINGWRCERTCGACETKMEVEASDILYKYISGDMRDPGYAYYYFPCPVCGTALEIIEKNIPKAVQLKIKTRYKTNEKD